MALTREQRVAALRWLGALYSIPQVISKLERRWNIKIYDADVRPLDPASSSTPLPPDDLEIFQIERRKVEAGDIPCGNANFRLALRNNAVLEFMENQQVGHALGVLDRIDETHVNKGAKPGEYPTKIEWIVRSAPVKKSE